MLRRSINFAWFSLFGFCSIETQEAIALACEEYWVKELQQAELLITQLLPYLVVKCLEMDGKSGGVYIKRLVMVKDALLLLDFDDESSRYTMMLMSLFSFHHKHAELDIRIFYSC